MRPESRLSPSPRRSPRLASRTPAQRSPPRWYRARLHIRRRTGDDARISLVAVCSSTTPSTLEQPYILECDDRLIRESLEELDLGRMNGRTSVRRTLNVPTSSPCCRRGASQKGTTVVDDPPSGEVVLRPEHRELQRAMLPNPAFQGRSRLSSMVPKFRSSEPKSAHGTK